MLEEAPVYYVGTNTGQIWRGSPEVASVYPAHQRLQALVIMVAIFLGFTMPITAPQVLWVNMVTSVALGLVISFEPHELDVMNRPPRAVDRPILTGFGIWRVIFVGLALLALTLWAFFWMKSQGASDQLARTV